MRIYRTRKQTRTRDSGSFWLSFSDLMSSLLLIIILILFYVMYQYFEMYEINMAEIARQQFDLDQANASLEEEPGTAGTGAEGAAERIYRLRLVNAERGITLSARVKRTDIPHGILMDKQYEQLESTSIAADHPLLIADALLYLYALAR